jgi:hypothetical protein
MSTDEPSGLEPVIPEPRAGPGVLRAEALTPVGTTRFLKEIIRET